MNTPGCHCTHDRDPAPRVAFAGSSTDAALGLGAFAVSTRSSAVSESSAVPPSSSRLPRLSSTRLPRLSSTRLLACRVRAAPPSCTARRQWCTRFHSLCTSFRGPSMAIVSTRTVTAPSGTAAGPPRPRPLDQLGSLSASGTHAAGSIVSPRRRRPRNAGSAPPPRVRPDRCRRRRSRSRRCRRETPLAARCHGRRWRHRRRHPVRRAAPGAGGSTAPRASPARSRQPHAEPHVGVGDGITRDGDAVHHVGASDELRHEARARPFVEIVRRPV